MDITPPQNLEAEQCILGSIIKDNDVLPDIIELIDPADFYRNSNGVIYQTILDLYNNTQPIDLVTLTDKLQNNDLLEAVGGVAYVAGLAHGVASTANAGYYAKIIKEKSQIRQVISKARRILNKAETGDFENVQELINIAESEMYEVGLKSVKNGLISVKDIAMQHIDTIHARRNKNGVTGLRTGLALLDSWTAGLQKGDLIIVAARPSMGKTAFAVQVGKDAAIQHQNNIAIFSLEMPKEQVFERLLINESMVDGQKVRIGKLNDEEAVKLARATNKISSANIYIDDTPGVTVPEIRTKCRKLKSNKGLDLIIIDYIQLMKSHKKCESRQREIAEISLALKNLAKDLMVPVIAISQLSRAVEQRNDKIPTMADLRESGSLEQDADLIIFLYRDEYYLKEKSNKKGIAEIIFAKQRNGPVGTIELGFLEKFTKFTPLTRVQQAEQIGHVVEGGWVPDEWTGKPSS